MVFPVLSLTTDTAPPPQPLKTCFWAPVLASQIAQVSSFDAVMISSLAVQATLQMPDSWASLISRSE